MKIQTATFANGTNGRRIELWWRRIHIRIEIARTRQKQKHP